MADKREVFPTLAGSTGEGVPLSQRQEGEAAAAQSGSIGFSFKDSSGNVVLPQLTADGKVKVDVEGANQELYDNQTVTGVLSTQTDVASVTLTASQTYTSIAFCASNMFPTLWELIQVDDVTTTVRGAWLTGPGQYQIDIHDCLKHLNIVAGASGVQTLKVAGTQLAGAASDMHVNLSVGR